MGFSISRNRKIGYRNKIIIFLLFVGVLVSALLGGFVFFSYKKQVDEKVRDNTTISLNRAVFDLDSRFEEINNFYLAFCADDRINYLVTHDLSNRDCDRLMDAADILAGNNILNDYINEFTLINVYTGKVLTNKGFYTIREMINSDEVSEIYERYTEEGRAFWNYKHDGTEVLYTSSDYRLTVSTKGMNYAVMLPRNSVQIKGILIINVDDAKIYDGIAERLQTEQQFAIVDGDGKLIYTSDYLFGQMCSENNELEDIININDSMGKSYILGSKNMNTLGWKVFIGFDQTMIDSTTTRYLMISLFMIIAAVASILLIVFRIVYSPVSNLAKMLDSNGKNKGDDLEKVVNHIEEITSQNEVLEGKIENNRIDMLELTERKLLNNELAVGELNETVSSFGLFSSLYYCNMTVVIHGDENNFGVRSEEKSILYSCCNIIKDEFADKISWIPIYLRGALWVVFEGEDTEEIKTDALCFFNRLSEVVMERHHMNIYAGVSAEHTNVAEFTDTIPESIRALNRYQDSSEGEESGSKCNFFTEYTYQNESVYDRTYDRDIAAAILAENKEQAYEVCNAFSRYLKNPDFSRSEIMAYVVQFVSSMTLAFMEMGLNAQNMYRLGTNEIYALLFELYDINKIRKFIKYNLIDSAWERLEITRDNQSPALLANIERLVAERKGNITLTECSDELGINPTYIWRLLKKERGKSFSEYQESYKLDEAKRLLTTTDLAVAEIATQLNYTNAQNFIRFFSKETGLTPGKYRKQQTEI